MDRERGRVLKGFGRLAAGAVGIETGKKKKSGVCPVPSRGFNGTIPCGRPIKKGWASCGNPQHETIAQGITGGDED